MFDSVFPFSSSSVNEKDIAANVTNNVTNAAATGQADYKKKAKAGSKGNKDDPGEVAFFVYKGYSSHFIQEVNKSLEAANLKNANCEFLYNFDYPIYPLFVI